MRGSRRGRRIYTPAPARLCTAVLLVAAAPLVPTRPLAAQTADEGGWRGPITPLSADHWAYAALDRLAAAGWIEPGRFDGARPMSVAAVGAVLEEAAHRAERAEFDGTGAHPGGRPRRAMAAFAREVWARFQQEFPAADDAATSAWLGYEERRDDDEPWRGTVLSPRIHWMPAASVGVSYEPRVRFSGSDAASVEHARFGVATRVRSVLLFAGRERLAFETGATGGVTLSDAAALDGVGLRLAEPVTLPFVGPVHGLLYLSRFGEDSLGSTSGFGAFRLALSPAPWLQLHLNRTILVARRIRGMEMSAGDLLLMLVGKHTAFEDQRASVGVRLRTNVAGWPVQPYLEWGFEDTAGVDEDPGIVTGIYLPFVPFAPGVSLRYEYTAFGEHAQLFPGAEFQPRAWYHHASGIRDRYLDDAGTPIGHPLGGYGFEHRVQVGGWVHDARLRLTVEAYRRHREEGNLLYDDRPGTSLGATADLHYALVAGGAVTIGFATEHGAAGWAARNVRVGVRW